MLIRSEIGVDATGIDALLRRCFPASAEADLVQRLREGGLLTLGMVATDDEGHVLGYAAFSPVLQNNEDKGWVILAPLAVDESVRGNGFSKKLICEGMDSLNEFGYSAVFVLGDPACFGRYGFTPAALYHLHFGRPGTEASFQVYPLTEQAFAGAQEQVDFTAPFKRF